jgi:hypothetical protein
VALLAFRKTVDQSISGVFIKDKMLRDSLPHLNNFQNGGVRLRSVEMFLDNDKYHQLRKQTCLFGEMLKNIQTRSWLSEVTLANAARCPTI